MVRDEVMYRGELKQEVYQEPSEVNVGCQHFVHWHVLESVSIAFQQYKLLVLGSPEHLY